MVGKLSEKQRKAIYIIGVTAAVYLIFKYLLPLVTPFLIAYLLAVLIRPGVEWLHRRFHLKKMIGAGVMLVLIIGLLIWVVCGVGQTLWQQIQSFISRLPIYLEYVNSWLKTCCSGIEKMLQMDEGVVFDGVIEMTRHMGDNLQDNAMTTVIDTSIPIIQVIFSAGVVISAAIVGVVYIIGDWDKITLWKSTSAFRVEIQIIFGKLSKVGKAYFRTQFILMLITAIICIIGLWLIGNPYALLLGIGIGVFDALPLLGTGLIFFPWLIVLVLTGEWMQAAQVATIYLICCFVREFMEAKLMGTNLGIRPLGTLISIYVGLQLFGFWGLFLGPIGYLLIDEVVKSSLKKDV